MLFILFQRLFTRSDFRSVYLFDRIFVLFIYLIKFSFCLFILWNSFYWFVWSDFHFVYLSCENFVLQRFVSFDDTTFSLSFEVSWTHFYWRYMLIWFKWLFSIQINASQFKHDSQNVRKKISHAILDLLHLSTKKQRAKKQRAKKKLSKKRREMITRMMKTKTIKTKKTKRMLKRMKKRMKKKMKKKKTKTKKMKKTKTKKTKTKKTKTKKTKKMMMKMTTTTMKMTMKKTMTTTMKMTTKQVKKFFRRRRRINWTNFWCWIKLTIY